MSSPSVSNNARPANYQPVANRDVQEPRTIAQGPGDPRPPVTQKDSVDQTGGAEPPPPSNGPNANPPPNASGAAPPDNTKELVAEVNKWTPNQLMTMLREGKIPEDIAANPQAMNLFLARIQEFSRMVQMMTNLLQVQHETLMSIIRNIKA